MQRPLLPSTTYNNKLLPVTTYNDERLPVTTYNDELLPVTTYNDELLPVTTYNGSVSGGCGAGGLDGVVCGGDAAAVAALVFLIYAVTVDGALSSCCLLCMK